MYAYLNDIQDLLLRHGHCLLPGIGLLLIEHAPARKDADLLLPPADRTILQDFRNPQGGVFSIIDHITSTEHIPRQEAEVQWTAIVKKILEKLSTGATVKIPGVGLLNITEDGVPCLDIDSIYPPLFEPLVVPPDEKMTPLSGEQKEAGEKGNQSLQPLSQENLPNEDLVFNRWNSMRRKYASAGWVIAIILALGLVIWFTYQGFISRKQKKAALKEMVIKSATPNKQIDSLQQVIDTIGDSHADSIHYTIVFSIFNDKVKAERQFKKMKGWGHPVVLLSDPSGIYKLGIPFTSLPADTTENLAKMRNTYGPKVLIDMTNP